MSSVPGNPEEVSQDPDDPTSGDYANQQELNRIEEITRKAQAEAERIDAENRKRAKDVAAQFGVVMDQYSSDHRAVVEESNQSAHEAIQALHEGEPLQDAPLPEPPVPPDDPEFGIPHPEHPIVIPAMLRTNLG